MCKKFDINEGVPLYKQVYDWIKSNIFEGEWEKGRQLPPEPTLAKDLGVSRSTVRKALGLLIDEGICYQQQGKGTFVSNTRSRYELTILTSFTEQMKARGKRPSSKVLEVSNNQKPDSLVQAKLGMSQNDRLIKIKRIRYGDDTPMSLETILMNDRECPGIEKQDLSVNSVYDLVENYYNCPIINGSISIEPREIKKEEAKHLQVQTNTAMMLMESITYTNNGRPLFITYAIYPKDRYVFTISMPRRRK